MANRGEIAVRDHSCLSRDAAFRTVAVYSECDRAALHVRYADEAYPIGPSAPRESYLRIEAITRRRRGDPAPTPMHPGYGFLAENEDFAAAVPRAGMTFIGPST
ncbi:MAG: biotin carboxylase N-terminal domain-containing protein [Vicinamibacterales bacterium]